MAIDSTLTSTELARVVSASSLSGIELMNPEQEKVGSIQELMLDLESGTIAYAMVQFDWSVETNETLLAVPWQSISLSPADRRAILQAPRGVPR